MRSSNLIERQSRPEKIYQQFDDTFRLNIISSKSKRLDGSFRAFMFEKETKDREYPSQYIGKCLLGLEILDFQNKGLWTGLSVAGKITLDAIINVSYTASIVKQQVLSMLDCKQEVFERSNEENIEFNVVSRYVLVPQVKCIYTDEYQNIKRFLIFTTNRKYDNGLMEHLLHIERDIRLSTTVPLSFEYIPKVIDGPKDVLCKDAKLIYQRGYDVFFSSTYMAGRSQQEVSQEVTWRFEPSRIIV